MHDNIPNFFIRGTDEDKVATIVQIKQWRGDKGQQLEENEPYDGWKLPENIPRFIGFGMALIQELGAPPGVGVQVPYRFALVADTVTDAMGEYLARNEEEAKKAYNQWITQQTASRIVKPRG